MKIYLVSCTSQKYPGGLLAQDKYMKSAWFRAARALAEAKGDEWYILSAKYGLLKPEDDEVNDYDVTLTKANFGERRRWAYNVFFQLKDVLPHRKCEIVFLAGKAYREFLASWLGTISYFEVQEPLANISGIGNQIKWMRESVSQD